MTNKQISEFLATVRQAAPGLLIERSPAQKFGAATDFILWGVQIGAFTAMWKAFELWASRHSSSKITVKFTNAQGQSVEYSREKLTQSELEAELAQCPPTADAPMVISVG